MEQEVHGRNPEHGDIEVKAMELFRQGADWAAYAVEDGTARLKILELGARNAEHAEVKQGLTDGSAVILHPSDQVADGVAVVVRPAD